MAEAILAVLCILLGVTAALLAVLSLWAGVSERAATGSGGTGLWPLVFAVIAVAGIGGGIAILI